MVPTIQGLLYITILGKDQNSKFKVWLLLNVYHFPTIAKSKKKKSQVEPS